MKTHRFFIYLWRFLCNHSQNWALNGNTNTPDTAMTPRNCWYCQGAGANPPLVSQCVLLCRNCALSRQTTVTCLHFMGLSCLVFTLSVISTSLSAPACSQLQTPMFSTHFLNFQTSTSLSPMLLLKLRRSKLSKLCHDCCTSDLSLWCQWESSQWLDSNDVYLSIENLQEQKLQNLPVQPVLLLILSHHTNYSQLQLTILAALLWTSLQFSNIFLMLLNPKLHTEFQMQYNFHFL